MNGGFKIRSANESDKEQVLKLLNDVFSSQQRMEYERDNAYWNWKFRDSAYGPSILTVAEYEAKIIGVDHLWPWEFRYKGEPLKAVQPCDAVVHPDYRGRGLFKTMRKYGLEEAERQGYQIAFNFPNENSLPGNRSVGAIYLGQISWWVRILKPFNLVKNRLFTSEKKDFQLPGAYNLNIEIIDKLAAQFKVTDEIITIHRVPGFHHWRYAAHPSRTYGMIDVRDGSKQTIVVFTVNPKGSSREMVVVDMIGDNSQKTGVVKSIVAAGREMGADFIAVMNNHQFGIKRLWTYRFLKMKSKNMVVTPINRELNDDVKSMENWSMLAGMHDSI